MSALSSGSSEGDCILWVDGSQGVVRAMDMVPSASGKEAIVRTLLRAMEYPHSPGQPARPQKVIVRDRETQFYLRGILPDLDIALEYAPDLPLIDEIFASFQQATTGKPPSLPPQYAEAVLAKAKQFWNDHPWNLLADHQILEIELNRWDLGSVYASVMGMLGMEFGILLYRSIDSLRQFRQRVLDDSDLGNMEEAFLTQDCLFLTYELQSEPQPTLAKGGLRLLSDPNEFEAVFGSLHPLEGLRSFLYDDEAIAMATILEALHRFFKQHHSKFKDGAFPDLSSRYKIPLIGEETEATSVKVSTLPPLAEELLNMVEEDFDGGVPLIRDDVIPDNAFLSLGVMPWDVLSIVRAQVKYHQAADVTEQGEGLPVILVQTSQPKAKALIDEIKAAGGLRGIGFNPGSDPMLGEKYDLGLLQTEDRALILFGEFGDEDPVHVQARKKWDQRCKNTQGYCGLVVAKGVTGASRGMPRINDMVGLFEVKALTIEELGIGQLERQSLVDWV